MRNTKYVMTQYCFYDRTGIRRMLQKQAAKGWLLEAITPFAWKYHRIEPSTIHFAVTYYPQVSQFDPCPNVMEELYQEFVAHSGWILAASNAQMQIFYNEAEDPVPIETDPLVEVENIHKAVKKSFLPSYFLMLAAAVMNLTMVGCRLASDFVGTLSSNTNLFTILCWTVLLFIELTEIVCYYLWRRRALRAARTEGAFVETRNRNNVTWMILGVVCVGLIMIITSVSADAAIAGVVACVLILGAAVIVVLFSQWMKKQGFSRQENRAYTIIATVVLSLTVTFLSTQVVISILDREPDDCQIQEEHGADDQLPLTIYDLTGESNGDYTLYQDVQSSLILNKLLVQQTGRPEMESEGGLRYVVVEVKWGFLFNACLHDYLDMYKDRRLVDALGSQYYATFCPVDPAPWGADTAYQLFRLEMESEYLLCYGDRIVNFDFSEVPTAEQMTLIAKTFSGEQKFENDKNK